MSGRLAPVTPAEVAALVDACPDGSAPTLRPVRRALTARLRDTPGDQVVALARALVEEGAVPRWIAYEILSHHPPAMRRLDVATVRALGEGMASWGQVDAFAGLVAGVAWREGRLPDGEILAWAASDDRWWRRAALVSTVPLNLRSRGGTGDPDRTLVVCEALVRDRDDMVVKALSWALRELAKHEGDRVRAFVAEHREELAARVLREVRNKLETGVKNPGRGRRGGGAGS